MAGSGAGLLLSSGLPGVSAVSARAAGLPMLGEYDVVVVGSGAAGMTAALTGAARGLRCVVVEKAPTFGGSAARSGAGIWFRATR
nr:FAD-dependent oxidoreductase [Streptomyces sp. A3M-1-3]